MSNIFVYYKILCYNKFVNNKLISEINPFKYRSYYFDIETGLYYLNSRYYDPEIGRFINADDIAIIDLTKDKINGFNLYSYCLNNAINLIDLNGNIAIGLLVVLGILTGATIAGGAIAGKNSYDDGNRGWDLVRDTFIGASIGLAVGGVTLMLGSMGVGLAFGVTTPILGITAFQTFAIGALSFDFTAFFVAPIVGLDLQAIDFKSPFKFEQSYSPNNTTQTLTPLKINKYKTFKFLKELILSRSKLNGKISRRNFKNLQK